MRTIRYIFPLIAAVMATAFVAQAQDRLTVSAVPRYDFAAIPGAQKFEGQTYSNSELGISLTLPECFKVVPAADTTKLAERAKAGTTDRMKEAINRTHILLNSMCTFPGDASLRANVLILAEPVTPGTTSKALAEANKKNSLPAPNLTLTEDVHSEKLGSQAFEAIGIDLAAGGSVIKQKYFFMTDANAGLTVILSVSSDTLLPAMMKGLNTFSKTKRS